MTKQATACVSLRGRALTTQRYGAVGSCHISIGQVGATIEILAMVACVTVLAKHRRPHRQHWRRVRPVRGVAIGAIVSYGRVLPQERSTLLRMAGVASLIYSFLRQ